MFAVITATTVHDYFWTWRKDDWPRLIYHAQITTAADYVDDLPEDTFVLFYSSRAPLDLEVFQFLAPDVEGANRSFEYSTSAARSNSTTRRGLPHSSSSTTTSTCCRKSKPQYPGGIERIFRHDGKFDIAVYEIPAQQ